ncbi:MAG: FAD-binding oxidoreductase [Candidatus Methanomethylophilaceae archaeon]|nr:FAD-binding oxidoreductase [Candidatus Methanomethylophilaceae archaeon]
MFQRQRIGHSTGYLTDESKMTGHADNVLLPYSEQELREILRVYNSKGTPVTIAAMRTGVSGGSVPNGGDVLSLEHMKGAVGVGKDKRGYFLRVLPCTTLDEIDDILTRKSFSSLEDITEGACDALAKEPVTYFYPVDPTEMSGSIGGNIAANASGPRTYKYGPTRDWVRRIRVVMADGTFTDVVRGEHLADGRRMSFPAGKNYYSFDLPRYDFNSSVKNATGPKIGENMDLLDLFIGSEGIFGVIAEADIYLAPRHPLVSNILFFPDDESALEAVKDIRSDDRIDPEFLEFMDVRSIELVRSRKKADPLSVRIPAIPEDAGSALFFDLPDDGSLDERYAILKGIAERHGTSLDKSWCGHEASDRERMRELRHSIPKTIFEYVASLKGEMPRIHKLGSDMSVPDGSADEMMAFYKKRLNEEGLEYCMFGHIGDNHPHVEIILKSMDEFNRAKAVYEEFAAKAVELGGSPSAEHGIGKIKTRYMELLYGKQGVEELRKVKKVLDPNGILCPGNMIG